jgi:hypothetical protein
MLMLMNAAPAELLQLLTTAALQPHHRCLVVCDRLCAVLTAHTVKARKEKAAMPEDWVRQCGLFFSRSVNA